MYPSPHDKQRKNRLAWVGRRNEIRTNDEGSVNSHFSPEEPKGNESHWFQTNPGEDSFAMFRNVSSMTRAGSWLTFKSDRLQVTW